LEHWTRRTLRDFARDSLKPTALAGLAMGRVERALLAALGPERTRTALGELVMGVHPDSEADLPSAMRDLAAGNLDQDGFLKRFGHRGNQEMELSQPRWNELSTVQTGSMLSRPAFSSGIRPRGEGGESMAPETAPLAAACGSVSSRERILAEANLSAQQRNLLAAELDRLHDLLALRETAKHYLMMGYALIRRVLIELDRRRDLNGGVFFLTPEELPRLVQGDDLSALIVERRRRRELALSLEVPPVLFSDDLEAIGRPSPLAQPAPPEDGGEGWARGEAAAVETLHGVPLSAGVAEGVAVVLQTPDTTAIPDEPYILVCPSTDPAWLPLFVRAKGLVMETGGVLSHGAIVAREFGLPAVAGLPDVHRRLSNGLRLRVDGGAGTVSVRTQS
jgi:pyruvate,water dikinase